MRYIATGRPASLRLTVRDEDGVAGDATGSVTVVIADDSGTTVQTTTATDVGDGEYKLPLSSTVRNALGVYSAVWSYTVSGSSATVATIFEIVGDVLFDVADLRAYDTALEDDERYTAEMIRDARDAATERIENAAQVAFVQRARRVTLSGNGFTRLLLPDAEVTTLEEVWLDLVQEDETEIDLKTEGIAIHPIAWTSGVNNVELRYVHGYKATPEPVRRAAMALAIEYLITSSMPARATAQSTDLGEFRITVANVDAGRDTGIPEVDAVIARFGRRRPVLG